MQLLQLFLFRSLFLHGDLSIHYKVQTIFYFPTKRSIDDLIRFFPNNYREYLVVFQGFLQNTHTSSGVSHGFSRPSQSHIKTENIALNTLKSQDLAGNSKKPQEMNSNLNEPFTAFKQANKFGPLPELAKSSLEIDLGPVNDVEPVFPLTTSEDIDNFFSLTERRPGGDSDLAGVNVTTSDFLSQTQNVTPDVGGDNNEIEIPVIIETVSNEGNFLSDFQFEDHPATSFGKLKLDENSDSSPGIRDSLIIDNRPVVTSLRQEQSNDNLIQTSSPPLRNQESSGSDQGIRDSLVIDLNDEDKNIIPKIPGNSVSFSFTRFGSGDRATSFGFNFKDEAETERSNRLVITTPRAQTTSRGFTTTTRPTERTSPATAQPNPFPTLSTVLQQTLQQTLQTSPTPARTSTPASTTSRTTANPFPTLPAGQLPVRTVPQQQQQQQQQQQ